MPRGGSRLPDETAADLRRRAAHVRRLARELVNEDDQRRLTEFAEELETRAASMEAKGEQ